MFMNAPSLIYEPTFRKWRPWGLFSRETLEDSCTLSSAGGGVNGEASRQLSCDFRLGVLHRKPTSRSRVAPGPGPPFPPKISSKSCSFQGISQQFYALLAKITLKAHSYFCVFSFSVILFLFCNHEMISCTGHL